MKTGEAKISAAAYKPIQKKRQPFFNKEGQNGFFAKSNESSDLFFSTATIQPKLSIGQPNDKYEKEADAMADQVVQRLATPEVLTKKDSAIQAKPIASTITPLIQTKCNECEAEEKEKEEIVQESPLELQLQPLFKSEPESPVQRKTTDTDSTALHSVNDLISTTSAPEHNLMGGNIGSKIIQAKCAACEQEEKEKEEIIQESPIELRRKLAYDSSQDPPDDNNIASEAGILQRKCAECEKEEKVQKQSDNNKGEATELSLIESGINSTKGHGEPMPAQTLMQMGAAFNADFSKVRIHKDDLAAKMNTQLGAQAFTQGDDIYFNKGKYKPRNSTGKRLLAHELTHTIQQGGYSPAKRLQRYSWDEFVGDVSDTADTAVETVSDVGEAIVDTAADVGEAVIDTGAAVVEVVTDAASDAIDLLATEAGQFAQSLVSLLGGTITVTTSGLVVTLPRMCPVPAITSAYILNPLSKNYMVPVFKVPVAPGVAVTGEVGLAGSLTPEVQLQLGPFCLDGVRIVINPLTGFYSISGSMSFTNAASLGAEIRGGVRGELSLEAVVPIGGVLVPVKVPVVAAEGGLAGLIRGIGAQTFRIGGSLSYSRGIITASPSMNLNMGLAADLFAGAYAQLDVGGEHFCRIYWQPYEWHGGIAYSLGLSADLIINSSGIPSFTPVINPPTLDQIPFDQFPLAISRTGFSDDCPIIDRICELLRSLNLLPSQNGGVWDWSGTGHGGLYGPGSLLPGPLEVFARNPLIASGATCRGACGPDCDTCEPYNFYFYTDPATGITWQYTNFQDCNSNDGCREHDAAYDWAAAEKGETGRWAVILPWHMAANIECACNNLAGNCPAWIFGLPPYDMKMYFADNVVPISSGGGPGIGPAQNECKEQNPDFIDCTNAGADRDEVLVLWGLDNGYKDFRNCKPHRDFPAGIISACDLGPGRTWHCTASDEDTGKAVTISIFECYCCNEYGYSGSDWRAPHLSIRVMGGPPSRAVPKISESTFREADKQIRAGNLALGLDLVMGDLIDSGRVNPALFSYRYVSRADEGEGYTATDYKLDPVTGNYVPEGPSTMEVYTPAFISMQLLVSTVMHEYQHVLQHQRESVPEDLTPGDEGGHAEEVSEAGEVESYLWEIEHADETGMATQPDNIRDTFRRLTDHYEELGQLNPRRQEEYHERYENARQFVADLEEAPPPMPRYSHVYHHGTDYDTVETLRTVDITAAGRVDFGQGFYTHTKGNWLLAREWAIRHSLGKKGWGVITFPIPDRPWNEEITEVLKFRNARSRPQNMPINPETDRPFKDWKDFVRYNKAQGRRGALPHWEEFDVIEGPLWGKLSRKPHIQQVMFTGSGVAVLNRPDVKPLRFLKRWLFLRFR